MEIRQVYIQSLLKSNSTSFMFNKEISEMKGKKVIHGGGVWGNHSNCFFKCNFSIYLDISILLGYPSNNHTFMPSIGPLCVGSVYIFIFLPYNSSPEKWRFQALNRLPLPQFSTDRHHTGFVVKRKQACITNYRGLPINL